MHRARAAQDGRYARGRGGATVHELMASFDWRTPGQAKVYTDAADRKRLAGKGIGLLDADRNENADCRTENSGSVAPEENPGLNPPGWQEWRDSNPQPPVLETGLLPTG